MRTLDKFSPLAGYTPPSPHLTSATPEEIERLAAGLTDEQALKKIGQRTTLTGRIVSMLVVAGVVGMVFLYMKRSEAYETRMDGLKAAGALEGDAMLSAIRAELDKTSYPDVKERALRNLGYFKDEASVPQMTQALKEAGIVRRAAALALARVGSPAADAAKPALMAALPNTDEKDRPQVVWALAVLKEPTASEAILNEFTKGLLQGQPGFDPKVITEALGIQKLASPALTGHEKKPVRTLVAVALAEAASPEVVDPLVRMIEKEDEDAEVVRAAIMGLGRAGDPRAAAPMFSLMQRRAVMRQSVLDALARSTAAPELAVLLKEAKTAINKRDLARLLHKTHDPRSADALAGLLSDQDEDVRIEAAQALAELGDERAVPTLIELARSEDDGTGNDAVDHLRMLGHPDAAPALMAMLEQFPHRKSALMRTLGASGAQEAGPLLVKELEGDDIGAAAKAIGQLKFERAYPKLVKMLVRDPKVDFTRPSVVSEMAYRNRYEAMQALRYFRRPDPKAARALITIIEDPEDDFRLRAAAGATLGEIADDSIYQLIMQKIGDQNLIEEIRVAYVQGLWRKPNPALSSQLLPLLKGETPTQIKIAVALAVGYAGNPANDAALLELLDDPSARRHAAFAVTLGGSVEAAKKLIGVLSQDRDSEEVLRLAVNSNEDDNFNLLTEPMFASGQVIRRLLVADALREGTGKNSFTHVWTHLTGRLAAGWEGPAGVSPRFVRDALVTAMQKGSPEVRTVVAKALSSMGERGLLLAARDAGVQEARQVLLALDQPRK
ncbi:MAG: HEAT repeat domain-containing protein [Myxococcales bacterium]|nr:HEAT repeat domain-containing protein [Myxococcales bacterium]MDD9971763.1 HEAT repeat domain-containing protein [Myxococcales bacterium]